MATLQQWITVRSLVDELSDDEFKQCLCSLVDKCGRKLMINLLNPLSSPIDDKACKEKVSMMRLVTEIIEDILRNRREQPALQKDISEIESLPQAVIGKIASNLNQWDFIDFAKCSRILYLYTNTPNTLHELDLSDVNDYSLIDLRLYPNVVSLHVILENFQDLAFPEDRKVLPCLTKMIIDNGGQTQGNIYYLIQCGFIEWSNVIYLTLTDFAAAEHWPNGFQKKKLLKLIEIFPKLIGLRFDGVYVKLDDWDEIIWDRLLPDLRVFADDGSTADCADSIIRSRAHQLEMVRFAEEDHTLPLDIKFKSLVEIECSSPFDDKVMKILGSLPNTSLKRVYFNLEDDSSNDALQLITDILTEQKRLEQCIVEGPISTLVDIVFALKCGIVNSAGKEQQNIELKLVIIPDISLTAADIWNEIIELITTLNKFVMSDFLFMWKFSDSPSCVKWVSNLPDIQEWKALTEKFAEQNKESFEIAFEARNLLISKKDSKIGGCILNYFWDGWLSFTI